MKNTNALKKKKNMVYKYRSEMRQGMDGAILSMQSYGMVTLKEMCPFLLPVVSLSYTYFIYTVIIIIIIIKLIKSPSFLINCILRRGTGCWVKMEKSFRVIKIHTVITKL
jgi:hypothetical protein